MCARGESAALRGWGHLHPPSQLLEVCASQSICLGEVGCCTFLDGSIRGVGCIAVCFLSSKQWWVAATHCHTGHVVVAQWVVGGHTRAHCAVVSTIILTHKMLVASSVLQAHSRDAYGFAAPHDGQPPPRCMYMGRIHFEVSVLALHHCHKASSS